MINFLITEYGIRPLNSTRFTGGYIILNPKDIIIKPDETIEIPTGLILQFQPIEFIYFVINDCFQNILKIMNPILQDNKDHIHILQIKNITNSPITINQSDQLCDFYAKDNSLLDLTKIEYENDNSGSNK